MNILIVFVSSSRDLIEFAARDRKAAIVPSDVLSRGYLGKYRWNVQVNAVKAEDFEHPRDFHRFLLSRSDGARILIVLFDEGLAHLTRDICTAAICCAIDRDLQPKQFQNYFSSLVARTMRAVNYLAPQFETFSDSVLLSLPLRNFSASEIACLRHAATNRFASAEFSSDIDSSLKQLRRRLRPRKRTASKSIVFAVDDQEKFFVLGKELHARPDSGGDHSPACIVTAQFRFGFRIDDRRHYNVSQGEGDRTFVSGRFMNCHSVELDVHTGTHLNMFSNDFF